MIIPKYNKFDQFIFHTESNGNKMTLFDKYGGVPTVTLIVRAFYKEVLGN